MTRFVSTSHDTRIPLHSTASTSLPRQSYCVLPPFSMTGQPVILVVFVQSSFARFDLPVLCKIAQLWNRIWRQKAFAAGEEVARTPLP
eukprot:1464124-Amphidinium_carterae.1